ncbi:hypothetical protein [Rhizobium indicum]|uniref:Uncharacterized protein n=1 Tax=Rhizobium indicum TaxID=2583231 RepID=A0ABX6PNZ2_9HYPH|nr:hypothetical protein [Rhizobium indicum]QKK20344.1 hypothetical protein FFM53_028425 [Rhizobium indicum]
MKFGQLSVDDANGRVVAHSLRLPEGTFSKGHVLKDCDLARLKQAELRHVTDARMNTDDVGEDQAAYMLGQSIATEDIKLSKATTGRVNVHSTVKGTFAIDKAAVDRLNAIAPAIAFACLADHAGVGIGTMIATFKIIPQAVHRSKIDEPAHSGG